MPSSREPWYAVCCKTLALRRGSWKQLDDAWEEQSSDSETGSTKSGTPNESGSNALDDDQNPEFVSLCCKPALDDEEFFSDVASDDGRIVDGVVPHVPVAMPDFRGCWVCTSTWGLEGFLKKSGVSRVQRMAAVSAPWPEWNFEQHESSFVFLNRGALGELREEFIVGGPEYYTKDGWKQTLRCTAHWEDDVLVIDRDGPQGCFREERSVDADGQLQFCLHALKDGTIAASWGRSFQRKV